MRTSQRLKMEDEVQFLETRQNNGLWCNEKCESISAPALEQEDEVEFLEDRQIGTLAEMALALRLQRRDIGSNPIGSTYWFLIQIYR